jgi:hypothetical protein
MRGNERSVGVRGLRLWVCPPPKMLTRSRTNEELRIMRPFFELILDFPLLRPLVVSIRGFHVEGENHVTITYPHYR